ncbi:MAG TPA: hypothetical protein VEK15_08905 [Vicinamibacteria bacterium]|nr:hypothetical protein [Vicinamibacteria bacterium]
MAKKKAKTRAAKKKSSKPVETTLDIKELLQEISDAQRELSRIQEKMAGLRPLCLRVRVLKLEDGKKGKHK